jgi:serpin B
MTFSKMRCGLITIAFALLLAARVGAVDFDVATATNQVGLDLYRQLAAAAPAGNLALSPYSIESALALAFAGADGATRTEMARTLYFPEEDQSLQTAFASLRDSLDRIAAGSAREEKIREAQGGQGDVVEWHAANRLFGQQGYDFRSSFLGLLQRGYDAPFMPVDFKSDPEQERLKINAWVEDQTKNNIRDLLPEGGIDPLSRLVLVNALYLKAPWASHFEKGATSVLPFHPGGEKTEKVSTMRKTANFDYLKGDGFTAIAIPYQGYDLQLLIVLPDDPNGLGALTARLTPALFRAYAHLGHPRLVALSMPKFRLEGSTIDLGQNLAALGMKTAFDQPQGSANFNRAAPRRPDDYLYISKVFHQTFIAIDEEGTEAAAATAIAMSFGLAVQMKPPQPIEVHVDHPFFFAIQDRASGTCLFLGSVVDPR